MSKLIDIYQNLKQEDNETMYMFKSGIFYIFLDDDAQKMHNELDLKLTKFNDEIVKCGFPSNALDKYFNLLSDLHYKIKIVVPSSNQIFKLKDFVITESMQNFISKIQNVDINNLSVSEAYKFIETLKEDASKIIF